MLAHSHLAEQTAIGHRSHFCRNEIIPPAAQPIAAASHWAWSWLAEAQHRGTCAPLLTHITHRAAPLLTTTLQPPRVKSALVQKQRKGPEEKPSSPASLKPAPPGHSPPLGWLHWVSGPLTPYQGTNLALLSQTPRAPPSLTFIVHIWLQTMGATWGEPSNSSAASS